MYIFQGDKYCNDCGLEKVVLNNKPDYPEPWDTDDYPKCVEAEYSDYPDHCGSGQYCLNAIELASGWKIGELLSTQLTSEGEEYLKDMVSHGGEVAEYWRVEFHWLFDDVIVD